MRLCAHMATFVAWALSLVTLASVSASLQASPLVRASFPCQKLQWQQLSQQESYKQEQGLPPLAMTTKNMVRELLGYLGNDNKHMVRVLLGYLGNDNKKYGERAPCIPSCNCPPPIVYLHCNCPPPIIVTPP